MGLEILDGISRDDVLGAIQVFEHGEVAHDFGDSTTYDLLVGEKRYPPKAILGIAGRRSNGRVLLPSEFSGGLESKCFRVLEKLGFTVVKKPGAAGDEWADDELDAAVEAYLGMLDKEVRGQPFSKAEVNRELREGRLSARGRGSIEYRMQNISHVLHTRGERWVVGYKPAANVGTNTQAKIAGAIDRVRKEAVGDIEPEPTGPGLEKKVKRARKRIGVLQPAGTATPERTMTTREEYKRDPVVRAWVLENAAGKCELCLSPAPFLDADGYPFLEVHHVEFMADGGSDKTSNAVALCPNCHRRCHISVDRAEAKENLYATVPRLRRE
jgi:5-methylcytosine-specific restriction protein A